MRKKTSSNTTTTQEKEYADLLRERKRLGKAIKPGGKHGVRGMFRNPKRKK